MNYTPIDFTEKTAFELLIERLKMCYQVITQNKLMLITKHEKCFELDSINFSKEDHNVFINSAFDNLVAEKCHGRVSEILGYDI